MVEGESQLQRFISDGNIVHSLPVNLIIKEKKNKSLDIDVDVTYTILIKIKERITFTSYDRE